MSELRDGMPEKIRVLIGRCEIGHANFSNAAMSAALHFGETCWRELCDFKDPTPLSELTDEQWEELGFEDAGGWCCRRMDRNGTELLLMIDPRGDITISTRAERGTLPEEECELTEHIKTLGQLRHLIAALGGEQ